MTTTAICGSDLHISDGYIPTMHRGDVLGHEFMGGVVEVGKDNDRLKVGDRVMVPLTITWAIVFSARNSCGRCVTTRTQTPGWPEALRLFRVGLFGYSHMYGGYMPDGQAESAHSYP